MARVDKLGGTTKENPKTKSGNTIRGVGKDNKQGWKYHLAANARFGKEADFTGNIRKVYP
ncbi:MAG: hypothetical protein JO257_10040 [Deltaproteobacteria bacterium]|nr:hypothetical protein [Deltaproteobacteria bacterium]